MRPIVVHTVSSSLLWRPEQFLLTRRIWKDRRGKNVPFLNHPRFFLQMRATAQEVDDATKYGQYCELFFFFLMLRETDLTEPVPARHVNAQHPARNDHVGQGALSNIRQWLSSSQVFRCSNILETGVMMKRQNGGGAGTHFENEAENPSHAREHDNGMRSTLFFFSRPRI